MLTSSKLFLKQMEIGPMQNFVYFIGDKTTQEIAVVDPAWDVEFLRKQAVDDGYTITSIFLTHGHPDHVNGLDAILTSHNVPVYISGHEADFFVPRCKNLQKVEDRKKLKIGTIEFECILTPGHTPGCQCFRYNDTLVTGDAIFIDGCGRCDLPGSSAKEMYHSLYKIIMPLPDETVIYPGHNYGPTPFDTLSHQKKTNPYLRCTSLEEFLHDRMGIPF